LHDVGVYISLAAHAAGASSTPPPEADAEGEGFTASSPLADSALAFAAGATTLEVGGLAELKYLPPPAFDEKNEYVRRLQSMGVCPLA